MTLASLEIPYSWLFSPLTAKRLVCRVRQRAIAFQHRPAIKRLVARYCLVFAWLRYWPPAYWLRPRLALLAVAKIDARPERADQNRRDCEYDWQQQQDKLQ